MAGTWCKSGASERRPIRFSVEAEAPSLLGHLRDHRAAISGTITVDGLAYDVPLRGTLVINPLLGRSIAYEFDFANAAGASYHFAGEKRVTLRDLARSLTELPATLTDAKGRPVGSAEMRFDPRDLLRFLASFRPV